MIAEHAPKCAIVGIHVERNKVQMDTTVRLEITVDLGELMVRARLVTKPHSSREKGA